MRSHSHDRIFFGRTFQIEGEFNAQIRGRLQFYPATEWSIAGIPTLNLHRSSIPPRIPEFPALSNFLKRFKTGCNPDCMLNYRYDVGSETSGDLAYESLSIGSGSDSMIAGIAFGCVHNNQGRGFFQGGGLVGLGTSPISLISKVHNKFTYCLLSITDSPSQTSPLIFGAAVNIHSRTFDLQSNGAGGMIIDSGATITYLVQKAIQNAIDLTPTDGSYLCIAIDLNMPWLSLVIGWYK
ncbi:aspartic proteinase nepenthesin-1-like [Cryptomeria japonica]|uniref:aspartic proteinase nepenthesin-1-like n=1 Tax=Cryptomeria japonica TaxID=3369 RepID=UPI0025AD68B1|nr:aspartic proteinase nepenthesin-1-like [Cryptomeria japonica]